MVNTVTLSLETYHELLNDLKSSNETCAKALEDEKHYKNLHSDLLQRFTDLQERYAELDKTYHAIYESFQMYRVHHSKVTE